MRENKKLKARLRNAHLECRRFAELEELYCEQLSLLTWHKTPLSAKRWARAIQRSRGVETPTTAAQEIARGLAKL